MNSTYPTLTDSDEPTLFPIRVLSEKTHVGTSTLRAWERRYGLLKPARTPKGHRLYSPDDINRVNKIIQLLDDGHSLPSIAGILASTQPRASSTTGSTPDTANLGTTWSRFIEATLDAVRDFNIERIDGLYNEASSLYPLDMVTEKLIQPTIRQLGRAWIEQPENGIAEEHFYTSWLRNRIAARFHHAYAHARGAKIVAACIPGSYHELGLMLFSLSALNHGYRVLYFGADLPFNQLPYIVGRSAARAVVLSANSEMEYQTCRELISTVRQMDTPVFLGGQKNFTDIDDFESAGGILLGDNLPVALSVFESHVPAYPDSRGKR